MGQRCYGRCCREVPKQPILCPSLTELTAGMSVVSPGDETLLGQITILRFQAGVVGNGTREVLP